MSKLWMVVALALGLGVRAAVASTPAGSRQASLSPDKAMALLSRPGRWIDTDGAPQADGSYLAKQVQIIDPATIQPNEQPSLQGPVVALDRARSSMRVLGYRVVWDGQTKFQDESKRVISNTKLQNGGGIKVQGKLLPNGDFKATKIKLQKERPGVTKPKTKIYGPVSVVNAHSGTLKILNTTIEVRPDAMVTEQPPQAPAPKSSPSAHSHTN